MNKPERKRNKIEGLAEAVDELLQKDQLVPPDQKPGQRDDHAKPRREPLK